MHRKNLAPVVLRGAVGADLAGVFEQMMMQLTLLGHTLPKSEDTLTPQQLKILFLLDFLAAPIPMSRLSSRLGVTPGTLTRVAAGLRGKGYVERDRSVEDERVVNLSLTARGRSAVIRIKQYRQRFFADLCGKLSISESRRLIESHLYILETYRKILQKKEGKP